MTKRILITGCAGFIGSHVVDECLKRGYSVVGIDDFSSGHRNNVNEEIKFFRSIAQWVVSDRKDNFMVEASVVDSTLLSEIFRRTLPDAVIHLAAQPSLLDSMKNPINDAKVNIMGTLGVLRSLSPLPYYPRLIFSSTSAVYPDCEPAAYFNEQAVNNGMPSSPYGVSKLAAEYYISTFFPKNSLIFRLANIYGPRQRPLGENQLIPRAIRHILNSDPFSIYGDGKQTRDFTYVGDVARIMVDAVEDEVTGVANLASGKSTSVSDVLSLIKEELDWNGEWKHAKKRDNRIHVEMSNERLSVAFKPPRKTLRVGLRETIKWWKSHEKHDFPRTTQTYRGKGKAGGR